MRAGRARVLAAVAALVAAAPARAQPADPAAAPAAGPPPTALVRRGAPLEIDDCPRLDVEASRAQLDRQGSELYQRAATLYEQGDYPGAVREFISAYCVARSLQNVKATGTILKTIGQAHERNLDYEKAIDYFERYLRDLPAEGASDKLAIESRILVLQKLRAQILVETEPKGATVTIADASGIAGRGRSGQAIEVVGGAYTLTVELAGHEPYTQPIEVRIGKPFAFFVPLRPQSGRLSVQLTPADARAFLRDKSIERFVGVGQVDEVLPTGDYVLVVEAPGREKETRPVEVLPNQTNRLQIDLPPRPQFARRQLLAAATGGGALVTGGLLAAFDNGSITTLGALGGAAAALVGSWLYLPEQVPLGQSNLTVTAGLAGAIAGGAGALLFTEDPRIVPPIISAATVVGAGAGYYLGGRTRISVGDAALINSSIGWGTAAGGLFALSFGNEDPRVATGLVLSGLGMGVVSGVLMSRFWEISRRRALLIDMGGIFGLIGGLAAESIAFPDSTRDTAGGREHIANFALGGMAIGLVGAGILSRSIDAPRLPVKAALGAATAVDGSRTALYGVAGRW